MRHSASVHTHTPALVEETIKALSVQPGGRYVDCTIGAGGHADAILKHSSPGGQLLGIDADPKAIKVAQKRLMDHGSSVLLINDNFTNLEAICIKHDFLPVHGILLDLGLSSLQLNSNGRGFSFQHDAPLDMRLHPSQETTAADIINSYPESKLAKLIKTYGEEPRSHRIAQLIVRERPIRTSFDLVRTIEHAIGQRRGKIHPATKTFQALRMAVNDELANLKSALKQSINLLGFEGRLVVINYHSLEDRVVKQFMQGESKGCVCPPNVPSCVCQHTPKLRVIAKKVITPSFGEIKRNPRSRSAKLRVAARIINTETSSGSADPVNLLVDTGNWRKPVLINKVRGMFFGISDSYHFGNFGGRN